MPAYDRDIYMPMFTVAQFTIAKLYNQVRCPPKNEWIKKLYADTQWSIIHP
jgi:hypothetical protein